MSHKGKKPKERERRGRVVYCRINPRSKAFIEFQKAMHVMQVFRLGPGGKSEKIPGPWVPIHYNLSVSCPEPWTISS
jgi:hypothetical protein